MVDTKLSDFAELWASDYHGLAEKFSDADVHMIEDKLQTKLPEDYIKAMCEVGVIGTTIELLDIIVDEELDLDPIDSFLTSNEVVDETLGWIKIGMPAHLIAIAGDGMGNKFCIRKTIGQAKPDSRVLFWDHDFNDIEIVGNSMDDWLVKYCELKG